MAVGQSEEERKRWKTVRAGSSNRELKTVMTVDGGLLFRLVMIVVGSSEEKYHR